MMYAGDMYGVGGFGADGERAVLLNMCPMGRGRGGLPRFRKYGWAIVASLK